MLKKYGIESIRSKYVNSKEEAIRFADGKSIVLKLISEKQLHKANAGLVKVNLDTNANIEKAFDELKGKGKSLSPYKIIAQDSAKQGVEAIIGSRVDSQFGKLILFGLGGSYVEALKDVSIRLCPIDKYQAGQMIEQLRSSALITHNGKATERIESLLMQASKMIEKENIEELDLNPVIIREDGYDIVDIRVLG